VGALLQVYRQWCEARPDVCGPNPTRADRETTILFDTVAAYLAFSEDLVRMEQAGVRVTDEGLTVPDPDAPPRRWAVDWKDLPAYEDLVVSRLLGRATAR
jgi:hypothetical protein